MDNPNLNEFLNHLASGRTEASDQLRLPSLNELSSELGISVARLREQMEVARAMGLVDVKPRTGIRRLPYTFEPAVYQSLAYAMQLDRIYFDAYADLRNHVEASYWYEAVERLTEEDLQELQSLIDSAWNKLRAEQVRIPHLEHRQLHLTIFRRLDNPFVTGILEAYWQAYEAVGLNVYAGYEYLQKVWEYHQRMVDAICAGNFEAGYQALVEHKDLLYHRPHPSSDAGRLNGQTDEDAPKHSAP
jgi:DNA-binding FadR family transcriptional regulator